MSKPILHIEDACISFGNGNLFKSFSTSLYAGELCCLTGESGKGKTTLLKAILGFIPLNAGKIWVNDIEVTLNNLAEVRKYTSWIPQELALPSEWVSDMVQVPFTLKNNRHIKFSKTRLLSYFKELGLDPVLYDRRLIEISGGQRQRIMIAVTAMLEKPLMIIDEPTSALDRESVVKVIEFLNKRKAEGIAILSVTHDKYFASACNKHFVLE